MITASKVLLGVAIASVFWGVASSAMIVGELQKRGIKINWFLLRLFIATRYVGQYRDITRKETGRTGWLYYSFVISMNTALVAAIAGLALRAL